jgi:Alpha-2,8-polysialyltransferase (POLYST)
MTTHVVVASTAFGLATATAAYDSSALEPSERRILVVTCNTTMPEATTPMQDLAGVPDLMRRFDAVYDYNACIEPQHPSIWHPRLADLPLWERHFRQLWELGNADLHLVVESIHVNPSQALCRIFGDARIDVYADGLMSYGPTRTALPEMVSCRIERLLHLDLVPGLRPLLLSERQVPTTMITTESFRAVAKTMVDERAAFDAFGKSNPTALIVDQYLAANGS